MIARIERPDGPPSQLVYNDADVIAGAATVAVGIFEDEPAIDTLVVPIGGGGLISGVAFVGISSRKAAATAALVGTRIEVRDRQVAVIVSGGNIDRARLASLL